MKLFGLLLVFVFFSSSSIYSQKPIYAGKILDKNGMEYTLTGITIAGFSTSDSQILNNDKDTQQYFSTRYGTSTATIEFNKIKSVKFIGNTLRPQDFPLLHKKAEILLVSGKKITALIQFNGYNEGTFSVAGINPDIGSVTRISLINIESIEFLHNGTFSKCPLCNTVYYNNSSSKCMFDQTPLVEVK